MFGWGLIGAAVLALSCSSSDRLAGGPDGGSDGGSASCTQTPPCGGDLVGTWRVTQSCVTATGTLTTCPGATTQIDFMIGGTVTYNADGTYSSIPTGGSATYHEHFPAGCAPYGLTCDELSQTLADGGAMITGSCTTDSTGACNCQGQEPETATNQTGTYTTSGQTVILVLDGKTSMASYCVKGGTLYETGEPTDGALNTMGSFVLARQ